MNNTEINSPRAGAGTGIPSDRALAAWEIGSLVSSALIAEWILSAAAGRTKLIVLVPAALAFALMITSHVLRGEGLGDLGFRFDNFLQALKVLAAPMIAVAILCAGLGLVLVRGPIPSAGIRSVSLVGSWPSVFSGGWCNSTRCRVLSIGARKSSGAKAYGACC